jgi:hypothetical protein
VILMTTDEMSSFSSSTVWGCFFTHCLSDTHTKSNHPVAGSCKYSDEPSGSGVTDLVSYTKSNHRG